GGRGVSATVGSQVLVGQFPLPETNQIEPERLMSGQYSMGIVPVSPSPLYPTLSRHRFRPIRAELLEEYDPAHRAVLPCLSPPGERYELPPRVARLQPVHPVFDLDREEPTVIECEPSVNEQVLGLEDPHDSEDLPVLDQVGQHLVLKRGGRRSTG